MTSKPTILVMAKAPRPGRVKTRLHSLLGPDGCADLQAALLRHTVATASATGQRVVVAFDPPEARAEIGGLVGDLGAVESIPQRGGHLGERMTAAADDALPDGGPLVVIGTDAPTLTADVLTSAFEALQAGSAAAIGPALDGGYYLLGLHWPAPDAFAIDPALWSGEHVAEATMARLRGVPGRATFAQLSTLRDLDTPEDAAALISEPDLPPAIARALQLQSASVSIIVPVLNEAPRIEACLLRLSSDFPEAELIVVDGGSTDDTAHLARTHAKVVDCKRGRGRQLNAGAAVAGGDVLWFIHADTTVDAAALGQMRTALADSRVVAGGCSLRFDRDTPSLRWLAWSSNQRARRLGQIFGDQAMFVRREVFDALGGFPDYPLMEDFEFSRRLHRAGRLTMLSATAVSSARRFEANGTWRMIVLMQVIKVLYLLGVSPRRLARLYEGRG